MNLRNKIKSIFRKDNSFTTTGPMEVVSLSGILVTGDGRRIRGTVLGPCIVTFPHSVKFIPVSKDDDRRGS